MTVSAIRGFYQDRGGSFTVEASLLFPMVLLCLFVVLFMALYVYLQASLYQAASLAADRAAYAWDNSFKQPVTGAYPVGSYDGLYWRTAEDDAFAGLLGSKSTSIQIPITSADRLGPEKKLQKAAGSQGNGVTGTLTYINRWIDRQVKADLHKPFHISHLLSRWLPEKEADAAVAARVVDPVEFIRNVNLARSYIHTIKGRISPAEAKSLMKEPAQGRDMPKITSERQASEYLRDLVQGKEESYKLKAGNSRVIDALDGNGVVHQAYYNFTENQLAREQMMKDIEMLRSSGSIRGVVWHFFGPNAGGKTGPSESFRRELEKNGILIVLH